MLARWTHGLGRLGDGGSEGLLHVDLYLRIKYPILCVGGMAMSGSFTKDVLPDILCKRCADGGEHAQASIKA